MVVVGLSPRTRQNKSSGVAERRLNGQTARWFSRRSATRDDVTPHRGLKSTATIRASLREASAELQLRAIPMRAIRAKLELCAPMIVAA